MRLFHKNIPFNPTIARNGNSIILYGSKQHVSVPNRGPTNLYELKVKNQTFFVECRTLQNGVEIATLNTNQGSYEFILKEAINHEQVIILNPNKPKANIDASDKALFYLDEQPEKLAKETKVQPPNSFWDYETSKLVYSAVQPLSARLTEHVAQVSESVQKSLKSINQSIEQQKIVLEKNISESFERLSKDQAQVVFESWNRLQESAISSLEKLVEKSDEYLDNKLTKELSEYAKKVTLEQFKTQQQDIQVETQNYFNSLSSQAFSWLQDQTTTLYQNIDHILLEKKSLTDNLLTEKIDSANIYVKSEFSNLEQEIAKKSKLLEQTINKRITRGAEKINESSILIDKALVDIPKKVTQICSSITDKWKAQIDESLIKVDERIENIRYFDKKFDKTTTDLKSNILEILEERVNNQKKEIDSEIKKYVDAAVQSVRMMALHASESGGGTTAVQYANGGTINGDLVINGSITATTYIGVSGGGTSNPAVETTVTTNSANWNNAYDTGTVYQTNSSTYAVADQLAGLFLPLSGGTITGNLTEFGQLSSSGTIYASGGFSDQWNNAYQTATIYQSNSATYATESFVVAMAIALG
jgi:hypothetical protein